VARRITLPRTDPARETRIVSREQDFLFAGRLRPVSHSGKGTCSVLPTRLARSRESFSLFSAPRRAAIFSVCRNCRHRATGGVPGIFVDLGGKSMQRRTLVRGFWLLILCTLASTSRADIYQWAWIDPNDPSQGKYQSSVLCPDGAGVSPTSNLDNLDLTQAYLIGADLWGMSFRSAVMTNADFSGANIYFIFQCDNANLTGANFSGANIGYASFSSVNLTNADFSGARLNNVGFSANLSLSQLYSTANYQSKILTGIGLSHADLTGANFAGLTLDTVGLSDCILTNADFSDADINGAYFSGSNFSTAQLYSTASFKTKNLNNVHLPDYLDFTGVSFAGFNIKNMNFFDSNFTNADFSNARLTNTNMAYDDLTNANFTGSTIRDSSFGPNLTVEQLRSTASFQAKSLVGDGLSMDLTGVSLAGFDLSGSGLGGCVLEGVDFSGSIVKGVGFDSSLSPSQLYSTASYKAKDLNGIRFDQMNLAGWNFAGQNLANSRFDRSPLDGADFTGAKIDGASFFGKFHGDSILSADQLYSTASYRARDLHGLELNYMTLTDWNFAGQNLDGCYFMESSLIGVDFRGALVDNYRLDDALTLHNVIFPDGTIKYLTLADGDKLVVRNYVVPIHATGTGPTFDSHATIQFVFDGNAEWGSTISFDSGFSLALAGTLDLTFADGVDPHSLAGETFRLFDWTDVDRTGEFNITSEGLPADEMWDTSKLYTTGEVTLVAVPEPGTGVLLASAAFAILWRRRKPK
jgi:uncharacterized protein YjbI with pentapeptide repeats